MTPLLKNLLTRRLSDRMDKFLTEAALSDADKAALRTALGILIGNAEGQIPLLGTGGKFSADRLPSPDVTPGAITQDDIAAAYGYDPGTQLMIVPGPVELSSPPVSAGIYVDLADTLLGGGNTDSVPLLYCGMYNANPFYATDGLISIDARPSQAIAYYNGTRICLRIFDAQSSTTVAWTSHVTSLLPWMAGPWDVQWDSGESSGGTEPVITEAGWSGIPGQHLYENNGDDTFGVYECARQYPVKWVRLT